MMSGHVNHTLSIYSILAFFVSNNKEIQRLIPLCIIQHCLVLVREQWTMSDTLWLEKKFQ